MMKTYPTAVVLSLYTGVLLCAFSDMHELAEYLVGTPVWTHQFASRAFVNEIADALKQQHPALAAVDASGVGKDNWQSFRDAEVARLGPTMQIGPMGEPEHYATAFTDPLVGKEVITISEPEPTR